MLGRSTILLAALFCSAALAQSPNRQDSSDGRGQSTVYDVANAKILANSALDGTRGTNRDFPILVQSAVFNRAVEMTEEMHVKWTMFDVETLGVGEVLFGIRDRYCSERAVCVADTDGDGRFDAGYTQSGFGPDRAQLFNTMSAQRPWLPAPASYKRISPPDSLRHEVGIAFTGQRKKDGRNVAVFALFARRAIANGKWEEVGGTQVAAAISEAGDTSVSIMGAQINIHLIDSKNFTWTVVRSMPEQPLHGTIGRSFGG